jgi:hypothetical protein
MTDLSLTDLLRLDSGNYGRHRRGELDPGETASWDQSHKRAWQAADEIDALADSVPRDQYDDAVAQASREKIQRLAVEEERDEARAKLAAVRDYAEDRSIHHRARKDSVVGSWRIASDLLAILNATTPGEQHDRGVEPEETS